MSSGSIVFRPRIEFDLDGYIRIRVWDPREKMDRYLYLHRCVLYARGELDSLWDDDRHGHHIDHDGWNNNPDNLETRDPDDHAQYHLHGGAEA